MWRRLLWKVLPLGAAVGDIPIADTADSPKLKKRKRFDIGKHKRTQSRRNELETLDQEINEKAKQLKDLQAQFDAKCQGFKKDILQKKNILELYERQIEKKHEEEQEIESQV